MKDIRVLKQPQRRFMRCVAAHRNLPHDQQLQELGMFPQKEVRHRGDLTDVFKIMEQLSKSTGYGGRYNSSLRGHETASRKEQEKQRQEIIPFRRV